MFWQYFLLSKPENEDENEEHQKVKIYKNVIYN